MTSVKKRYIEDKIEKSVNMIEEILKMKKRKNVIILAHYYQKEEIQDIADFVGDSLALSQEAARTDADIILFAGVYFMAETAKILSPFKKVLIPDIQAGCSLADSCPPERFAEFINKYPDHTIISYINTTAEIKALSDIICTSSNALQIINSLPIDEKIIFAPDKNLGNYLKSISGKENMIIWDGACHVHEAFSLEKIIELKKINPESKLIAHPECEKPILIIADHIGSTASLLKFTINDSSLSYIIATEPGIIHQMKKANPHKIFIPAPPKDSSCACSNCEFMKLITVKKLYNCLKYESPEVTLNEKTRSMAERPIRRMFEIST